MNKKVSLPRYGLFLNSHYQRNHGPVRSFHVGNLIIQHNVGYLEIPLRNTVPGLGFPKPSQNAAIKRTYLMKKLDFLNICHVL